VRVALGFWDPHPPQTLPRGEDRRLAGLLPHHTMGFKLMLPDGHKRFLSSVMGRIISYALPRRMNTAAVVRMRQMRMLQPQRRKTQRFSNRLRRKK